MSFEVPKPVADALRALIRVAAFYNIRLDQMLETPEAFTVRKAVERAEALDAVVEKLERRNAKLVRRVAELETQLGIEDEL